MSYSASLYAYAGQFLLVGNDVPLFSNCFRPLLIRARSLSKNYPFLCTRLRDDESREEDAHFPLELKCRFRNRLRADVHPGWGNIGISPSTRLNPASFIAPRQDVSRYCVRRHASSNFFKRLNAFRN